MSCLFRYPPHEMQEKCWQIVALHALPIHVKFCEINAVLNVILLIILTSSWQVEYWTLFI